MEDFSNFLVYRRIWTLAVLIVLVNPTEPVSIVTEITVTLDESDLLYSTGENFISDLPDTRIIILNYVEDDTDLWRSEIT